MKVWVTGANGLLGQTLLKTLHQREIPAIGSTRKEADLTSLSSLRSFLSQHPTITHIVNTAAYTQVDQAELEPQKAHAVNALGPEFLACLAKEHQLHLLHISTDYVFGAEERQTPYKEEESTCPVNLYGKTKREGEERLFHTFHSGCILRTSWLFHTHGSHFVTRILQAFKEKKPLKIPQNQVGAPTFVPDLCEAILSLLSHSGLFHFANQGSVSRYDYACALRTMSGAQVTIEPLLSTPSSSLAQRPAYSVLNIQKISQVLGTIPRTWEEALQDLCLAL